MPDTQAFPSQNETGFTKRQYAALVLRIPDSGLVWLDELITQANERQVLAEKLILAGVLLSGGISSRSTLESLSYRSHDLLATHAAEMVAILTQKIAG